MIREVDLVSYLPLFLREYQELTAALQAEDPEFTLIWSGTDRALKNQFIETADEYGLSRFETMLGILVSKEDTVESRRRRVQARWFNSLPYTYLAFFKRLAALCGDSRFVITKEYEYYRIEIDTNLEEFGQVEELEHLVDYMLPCNMIVVLRNYLLCRAEAKIFFAGVPCSHFEFLITNDERSVTTIHGGYGFGGGTCYEADFTAINENTADAVFSER